MDRTSEWSELRDALAEHSVVVVLGPPGVGKTALVRAHLDARNEDWIRSEFQGDVGRERALRRLAEEASIEWSADLALEEALEAVAKGVRRAADGVWIDGVDPAADWNPLFQGLARRLDSTRLLLTSRGELGLPAAGRLQLRGLNVDAAIDLFERSARRVVPDFRVDSSNVDEVERIVGRLDGWPLPVELAASRMAILSPAQLLERLEEDLGVLDSSSFERESFRKTIESAWELLGESERACLRQASVFTADAPVEAFEHVVQLPADGSDFSVLEILNRLVRASWLRRNPEGASGEVRFDLWESVRPFARSRFERFEDTREVSERYAQFYLRRAADLAATVPSPTGLNALDRLDRMRPHLLGLFDAMREHSPERATRALWALRWNARFGTAREPLLQRLRSQSESFWDALSGPWRARAVVLHGELELRRDRYRRAADRLEEAWEYARTCDEPDLRAECAAISSAALARLDASAAEERIRETLSEVAGGEAPELEGRLRERLGFVQLQTFRLEEARQSFRRARDLLSAHTNALLAAPSTVGLAYVALRTGHVTAATTAFGEAARLYERADAPAREADARFNWAVALHAAGDSRKALSEVERALEIWERRGTSRYETIARTRLGLIRAEIGEPGDARDDLEEAVAAGHGSGDWHNRAIAETALRLLGLLEEGPDAPDRELEDAIREMEFASDPDAAAAALALSAIFSARRGRRDAARSAIERIESIRSLLSTDDRYLLRVVEGIYALATTWVDQLLEEHVPASSGRDGRGREILRRFVPSMFEDTARAREQSRQIANPYLRLLTNAAAPYLADQTPSEFRLTDAKPSESDEILTVHREGHWFQIGEDSPVNLMSRQPLRRIVASIVESHLREDAPGRGVDELVEAGWPEAYVTDDAGANRVYTAIRSLRDMGLEGYLVTRSAGYRFDASEAVRCTERSLQETAN